MKKLNVLITLLVLILFGSCNPKISTSITKKYSPLDYKQEVVVIGLNQADPDDAELLGQIKLGDTGFTTNCSYDVVIDKAKLEARKIGGNVIKIVKHRLPNAMGSSCHRIKAKILRIENTELLLNLEKEAKAETEEAEKILPDVDYAILNIYRHSEIPIISYDLYLGDSVICRVKNNYKTTLYIKEDGLNVLWAETEIRAEIPISIKKGKTYYLRCGHTVGLYVGCPILELVDNKIGKTEFELLNAKNQ